MHCVLFCLWLQFCSESFLPWRQVHIHVIVNSVTDESVCIQWYSFNFSTLTAIEEHDRNDWWESPLQGCAMHEDLNMSLVSSCSHLTCPADVPLTTSHLTPVVVELVYGTYRQSEKLNSIISPTCPYNMVNFGLLNALNNNTTGSGWDCFVSLGHPR